jgi:tetratricopeptide (TPR) repeat protein
MLFTQPLYGQSQTPAILDDGEKAAKAILANIEMPPPNVAADQWAKLRPAVEVMAEKNLGFIAMQRKNWDEAEADLQKSLAMTPNDATLDYQLGTVIASEKKLDKLPIAMFYFARAATYQGPGALTPEGQKAALTYVQKQYKNFHGSDEGFNELVAAAKANPTPPAGFTIKNANELAQASAANEEEYNKSHPSEALWAGIKMALTAPDGANYFNMMKGSEVPTLKGKVIKLEPAVRPKTILLAMQDRSNNTTTADATLKFEMPLAGKVEEGTELSFEGTADSYTASPFMVVFTLEKDKLHGWTGKNEPAAPHRPRPKPAQ